MNRIAAMIGAEFLVLRKRRGLMALTAVLTIGGILLANLVLTLYHLSNAAQYGPAGGAHGLSNATTLFEVTGSLAAILVGATAGAQHFESGVFRSLVATGRSRFAIALARIPAALMVILPMLFLAYGLEIGAVYLFADGTTLPSTTTVLVELGWIGAVGVLDCCLALGIAALTGTRAGAVGLLVAWEVAGSRIIERFSAFGSWRGLISTVATDRLLPNATDTIQLNHIDSITLTLGAALAVVAAWILVASALGVWRTVTRDA
ncbi:MAG: hypothetical protein JO247_23890 [Chloroflexi bacterium]|nr:hypothetical protein [Chloroflexota bacterium]